MLIQPVFTNFIAYDYLEIDNEALADYSFKLEKKNPDYQISEYGGWHSRFLDLTSPELAPLVNEIQLRLEASCEYAGLSDKYAPVIKDLWINILREHKYINAHNHPGYMFSGCYYVTTPANCGNLFFMNPLQEVSFVITPPMIGEYNPFNSAVWEIKPEPGKLVIFPSWLMHYIKPNQSSEPRISIAFNVELVPKTVDKLLE